MTKHEILGFGKDGKKLSPEEIFVLDVADFRYRFNSLNSCLRTSLWRTNVFSYSQKSRLECLCDELEKLVRDMNSWEFYGQKDQMELNFEKK